MIHDLAAALGIVGTHKVYRFFPTRSRIRSRTGFLLAGVRNAYRIVSGVWESARDKELLPLGAPNREGVYPKIVGTCFISVLRLSKVSTPAIHHLNSETDYY